LSASLSILFTYLANRANVLQPNLANTLTQVAIFILLVVTSYAVWRNIYLHQGDKRHNQQLVDQQVHLSAVQDELLATDTHALGQLSNEVGTIAATLPPSKGSEIITKGHATFEGVLRKILIASHLRGSISSEAFQTTSLAQIIETAKSNMNDTLTAKNIRLAIEDKPLSTRQPELLAYVIQNVLDNAIAYSPQSGEIKIELSNKDHKQAITITDKGAGIPADKLEMLFRPFERAEDAMRFDREGMGFSLYLDRLIMTYLGGTITATSEVAKGTVVTMTLPNPSSFQEAS
jgi:signal transduction histidine kinase